MYIKESKKNDYELEFRFMDSRFLMSIIKTINLNFIVVIEVESNTAVTIDYKFVYCCCNNLNGFDRHLCTLDPSCHNH